MILLLLSFTGGVLTVLAPCVLPLLPIIVGGSLVGKKFDRKKALVISASLGISVVAFTLLLKASTLFLHVPEHIWRWISGGIIILLGINFIFPSLWEHSLADKVNRGSSSLLKKGVGKKSLWGDILTGAALGPVFSSCSPTYFVVLATILPVRPLLGMVYLVAYALGLCLTLLFVALVGQRIMARLSLAGDPRGLFKRVVGVLFILVGIALMTGLEKKWESSLLQSGFFNSTKLEEKLLNIQR